MQLEVSPVSPRGFRTPCPVEHLFSEGGKKRPDGGILSPSKRNIPTARLPRACRDFYLAGEEVKAELRVDASTSPSPVFPSPSPLRFLAQRLSPVGRRIFIPGVKPRAMLS